MSGTEATQGRVKVVVEAWAPEYGSPLEEYGALEASGPVDVNVEVPAAQWQPLTPGADADLPDIIDFVDGVRRIDARIWIESIPFNETRKYVRRVLEAETIFHWRMTGERRRLSDQLPEVRANLLASR